MDRPNHSSVRSHCALIALGLAAYSLAFLAGTMESLQASEPPDFGAIGVPYLEKYCSKCHGAESPEAEIALTAFTDAESLIKQRKIWTNVTKQLQSGSMPPDGNPRPTTAESEAFLELVRTIFDHADKNAKPDPGRVTMRRLNRVEYRNTIRDLVGVDFDPTADFPSDDIGYGFDNIGDVLSLPPVLMERYLDAADSIMNRAITPDAPPVTKRHLGSQYTEPASADVASKLMENSYRRLDTAGKDGLEQGPIHTLYSWDSEGEYVFRTKAYGQSGNGQPVKIAILLHGKGLVDPSTDAELDAISGNVLRPAKILKLVEVKGTSPDQAELIEVMLPAVSNRERILVGQVKPADAQNSSKAFIEFLALDGPLDTRPKSQRKLLQATTGKSQAEQTEEVLSRFLRRAYRRKVEPEELRRTCQFVQTRIDQGDKWEAAIQLAMQAILCSPKFLFRMELEEQATTDSNPLEIEALPPFHLASRLSYFLWSSMPDDMLLDLAESGKLAGELDAQVSRMLEDPRARSLVQNFVTQWLQIQRLDSIAPDNKLFPTFSPTLRRSMLQETELFADAILRENRSILELIDAEFTFLNEPLAKHYGIVDTAGNGIGQAPTKPDGKPIQGESFQRVALQDRNRGGLLTQASILTVTSNPTRTSPVKRGRWILEQILGAPPPPPPPNVPELPNQAEDVTSASLRKRMEVHRQNPACANCHAKMDPIGFALENFDAIGAYRTKDGPFEIDASGEFADGTRFAGPSDLKSIIAAKKEDFIRCVTEKMLTYAIGRGVEYYDRPTVEGIVESLPNQGYRMRSLIAEIVKSDAFRQRRRMQP